LQWPTVFFKRGQLESLWETGNVLRRPFLCPSECSANSPSSRVHTSVWPASLLVPWGVGPDVGKPSLAPLIAAVEHGAAANSLFNFRSCPGTRACAAEADHLPVIAGGTATEHFVLPTSRGPAPNAPPMFFIAERPLSQVHLPSRYRSCFVTGGHADALASMTPCCEAFFYRSCVHASIAHTRGVTAGT